MKLLFQEKKLVKKMNKLKYFLHPFKPKNNLDY